MKAVVFGIGSYYQAKKKSILERYEIVGFMDSTVKVSVEQKGEDNLPLLNPERVGLFPDALILLMSVKYMEMWQKLVSLGVDSERIVFGMDFDPPYDMTESELNKAGFRLSAKQNHISLEDGAGHKYCFQCEEEQKNCLRMLFQRLKPEIRIISKLPVTPISRRYGKEHGTPIDRYYIESFLDENRDKIYGAVGEFAGNNYTRRFGRDVTKSYIFHVDGWGENVIKVNLATGEGIRENMLDCLICTQVLQFINDVETAIKNMNRLLKAGGYLLLTGHGISKLSLYDYRNWGEYWRFTDKALQHLFSDCSDWENLRIVSYGNVKTASAMLYGLTVEDLDEKDVEINDMQYPVTLGLLAQKTGKK
ncbi:MAG: methyltransferase domain-containing protein [Lachnospiraceae bacterium]|nr:methyltransferase domain-containing protein [Lachnospiraceae bacterium]